MMIVLQIDKANPETLEKTTGNEVAIIIIELLFYVNTPLNQVSVGVFIQTGWAPTPVMMRHSRKCGHGSPHR